MFSSINGFYGVVDMVGIEMVLDDFEVMIFFKYKVGSWDVDIVEGNVVVVMGCIVVVVDRKYVVDSDVFCVWWYKDDGLLFVWVFVVGVIFVYDDVDFVVWVIGIIGLLFLCCVVSVM